MVLTFPALNVGKGHSTRRSVALESLEGKKTWPTVPYLLSNLRVTPLLLLVTKNNQLFWLIVCSIELNLGLQSKECQAAWYS